VTTLLRALLVADARRDARRTGRIGAGWKTTRTTTIMTTPTAAEVSEAAATATEGEGSVRVITSSGIKYIIT
jgi:hypothetical protein